jgi:hypothetical protein
VKVENNLSATSCCRLKSALEHSESGLALAWLQFQESGAGGLDIARRATLSGGPERDGSRMIGTANEDQGLGKTPHGFAVDRAFIHSGKLQGA